MSKKIVVSFPGGRGPEVPLLYFGAKYYEDQGYEKIFVNHPASGDINFESLYNNAKSVLENIDFNEYEDVIFVAKSIGTVVACRIKQELGISASLVLYTPLEGTLPYMHKDNQILLVAAGDTDRHLDTSILQELCKRETIPYYIEENIGHRMEVPNNLKRNLEVIENVISRL